MVLVDLVFDPTDVLNVTVSKDGIYNYATISLKESDTSKVFLSSEWEESDVLPPLAQKIMAAIENNRTKAHVINKGKVKETVYTFLVSDVDALVDELLNAL